MGNRCNNSLPRCNALLVDVTLRYYTVTTSKHGLRRNQMTKTEQTFIRELETVSAALAAWAQTQIGNGWSVNDVKLAFRAAATLAGRD